MSVSYATIPAAPIPQTFLHEDLTDVATTQHQTIVGLVAGFCTLSSGGTLQSNSFNVSSTTKNSTGRYTLTLDTDFSNA